MGNEDFKVLECTENEIRVNREPKNEEEWDMMKAAFNDAIVRKMLQGQSKDIIYSK